MYDRENQKEDTIASTKISERTLEETDTRRYTVFYNDEEVRTEVGHAEAKKAILDGFKLGKRIKVINVSTT